MNETSTKTERPSTIPWPPILLVGAISGAIALGTLAPLAWPGINDTAAQLVGLGFGAAGLAIAAWAIWTLYRERTNILPHMGADKLVTSGPYARFRNPIYLGDALILLGLAQLTNNVWFAIMSPVFAILVTWLAILPEEHHLDQKFGDAYRNYKQKSRRWI